jgi:hypothetical protein
MNHVEMPEMWSEVRQTGTRSLLRKSPKTIDEYIAAQDETVQPRLGEVREILRTAIPDAEERISWSMPTYWKHGLPDTSTG